MERGGALEDKRHLFLKAKSLTPEATFGSAWRSVWKGKFLAANSLRAYRGDVCERELTSKR